jgi:hypothetical protein
VSQPSLVNPGAEGHAQKQSTNVYTVMLIVSFICIVTACILLYAELRRWGSYPWWNVSTATPTTQAYYLPLQGPDAVNLPC